MKKFTIKRNVPFPGFAVLCIIAAIFSLVLLGCETDTKPEGGEIYFQLSSSIYFHQNELESSSNMEICFNNDVVSSLTDAQKAAVRSLTIADLNCDPKTDGNRTLELKAGDRGTNGYDANGFMQDYSGSIYFSVKQVRSAAPSSEESPQSTTLTIANKKGYSFKPPSDSRAKFRW